MFTNTLFLLSAAVTLGGAFAVVYTSNLMHACIYLLASFFGVAGLYACIGADFLAASQLVIYSGGVTILMLFAIMLTGGSANRINRFGLLKVAAMGNRKTYLMAGFAGIIAAFVAMKILAMILIAQPEKILIANEPTVEKLGTLLATDHILAFEMSSVVLLGALIGAAVISRPRREIHD